MNPVPGLLRRAIGSLSEQWQRFAESLISQRRQIRGLPVRVINTRRDIDTTLGRSH